MEPLPSHLSTKTIPPEERLIFALDLPDPQEARRMVEALAEAVVFYKLGLELFMAGGYLELVDWLTGQGKKVFVDLKFFDIPETVAGAVRQLRRRPVTFATVHGNDGILEAACREKGEVKILAVTALTSLDRGDLDDLGFQVDVSRLVLSRARRALALGCDGVISSGLEARALREELGEGLIIVTPGIRPVDNRAVGDQKPVAVGDQKRVVSVEDAFRGGADYIVVGRPIRQAADPYRAALDIQKTISGLFL